ncbi:siderophore-interacting protein [Gordonia jinhuaensis]|uniref:Siderophore-interacting protein n=1 Tax=Gordonia jinhuaensis TaxID=1517702 RepID=A0A916X177_9ACTN|nr:siderophore-interacting protein [Gordonia jinhuaensis]GGB46213.1 siderophore-interacting protein [Gordonia jinhuaensis]
MNIPGIENQSTARVSKVEDLGERLRRITFAVDEFETLNRPGVPDEAVGIYFPDTVDPLDPSGLPQGRNYSIRAVEGSSVVIDFVLHDRGVATTWARGVAVGDEVALVMPRSWYEPPADAAWQLLVADLTGLPALARILEEADTDAELHVILEVDDKDSVNHLPHRDDVKVTVSAGTGNGHAQSVLGDLVAAFDVPSGRGYCWFAGEASESRSVRKHFRKNHGFGTDQLDVLGYWRVDAERYEKRYAEVSDEMYAVYQRAIDEGKSDRVARIEFDEALEELGL